jgi:hypothetical protein
MPSLPMQTSKRSIKELRVGSRLIIIFNKKLFEGKLLENSHHFIEQCIHKQNKRQNPRNAYLE